MDGATVGLPIAQTIFSHFAELFLIKMDALLAEKCPEIVAIRVDDSYFIFGKTKDECSKILFQLSKLLRSYKFYLNGLKSTCVENLTPQKWDDLMVKPKACEEVVNMFRLPQGQQNECSIKLLLDHQFLCQWFIEDWDVETEEDLLTRLLQDFPSTHVAIFKKIIDHELAQKFVSVFFKRNEYLYATHPTIQLIWCLWVCFKRSLRIGNYSSKIRELDDPLINLLMDMIEKKPTSKPYGYFKKLVNNI
eukprot:NODE_1_length_95616_cov_0.657642.p41 type:complete len:248 gc:universal NODE_1_length_95616_cov_0.657642:11247-11990(+)